MKKVVLFLFIAGCLQCNIGYSQSLTGIWQLNTSEVSSGYLETYQFFSNGTFRYNTNQGDGLRRVLSLGGKYKIAAKKIVFTVEYTIEVVGGNLKRDEISPGNDSWLIAGGQTKKMNLLKPVLQSASIESELKDNEGSLITIDKRKYYKVDNDPNNFQ